MLGVEFDLDAKGVGLVGEPHAQDLIAVNHKPHLATHPDSIPRRRDKYQVKFDLKPCGKRFTRDDRARQLAPQCARYAELLRRPR